MIPEETLEEYEELFERILKGTNCSTIDELIQTFIEAEERNFTLTKYVNELIEENNKLDIEI